VKQYGQWYCHSCKKYQTPRVQPAGPAQPAQQARQQAPRAAAAPMAVNPIWSQNFYRIRKKVLTVWNKYWIEDHSKNILGFSKQKMFKLKEDIRIYTDEKMHTELFSIKQQQILDIWGTFAVVDSNTNAHLGYIKRKALASSFVRDEYELYDVNNQLIGGIYEDTGTGLARKYIPGGSLIPEEMTIVLQGQPVARINQKFKIIGDIWELNCVNVPQYLDRRVLLACLIMMGMIERQRK
jgi:hypothetical protein